MASAGCIGLKGGGNSSCFLAIIPVAASFVHQGQDNLGNSAIALIMQHAYAMVRADSESCDK
jgi:hypothetical protein